MWWQATVWAVVALLVLAAGGMMLWLRSDGCVVRGIDVSHHQGEIDWRKVKNQGGVEFAYVKATEGAATVDECYARNVEEARRAGVLVGAYHFFRADRPGESQFCNFSKVVGTKPLDLRPMLDLEADGGAVKDRAEYQLQVEAFVRCCEREYGVTPVIYSGLSFWQDNVQPAASWCPYWAAWYPVQWPWLRRLTDWLLDLTGRKRVLDWLRPGTGACMWQYSETGRVAGIDGYVDLDECWTEELRVNREK